MNACVPNFPGYPAFIIGVICVICGSNCLRNLQTIPARIANVEPPPARHRHVVGNDLHARVSKSLLSVSKVTPRVANMSLADAMLSSRFFKRKVQLHLTELIPRSATCTRRLRLLHLLQTHHNTIEMLRRVFERFRHGDVDVVKARVHLVFSEKPAAASNCFSRSATPG